MDVIPVIDLMRGAVVRARLGLRESYAPIKTPLASTSAPADVVAGLLTLYPFRTFYVADLDAIASRGDHHATLDALGAAFPELAFWVDAGVANAAQARSWLARHKRATLVLGSESLTDAASLEELRSEQRLILSLDFQGDDFLGPQALLAAPSLWPSRVIAMTLGRVGGHAGPDLHRLGSVVAVTKAAVYAAGGVRGPADLEALAQAGARGVLIASALHDGRLTRADLAGVLR